MNVPVLIPARNEAAHIATTLKSLPEEAEPFVIPNSCTDNTAEIAEDFGANVLEGSPDGKLPALQFAINHLSERALEPFVILDADSQPIFPDEWLGALLDARAELDPQQPAIITGPYVLAGINPLRAVIKNRYLHRATRRYYKDSTWAMSAANMLFDLQREDVVLAVQKLPNIWPGEDVALRETVTEHSGHAANTINRKARIRTDAADRETSLDSPTRMSTYLADAAPDAVTYWEFRAQRAKTAQVDLT